MRGILELDIVSGSGVGHETPVFEALSERSNYIRDSQSTVAGSPSCASVALRRRLLRVKWNTTSPEWSVSELILLYVNFCTIMAISQQKEGRSREYALLSTNDFKGGLRTVWSTVYAQLL